jgi:DNA-binding SARP family transcriptional activator
MVDSIPILRLSGPPTLAAGEGASPVPLERKDAALLALLALDGPVARDAAASWLWPDVPLKQANLSLRQRIFRLRRKSGHELVHTGPTLSLAEGLRVDLLAPPGGPNVPSDEATDGIEAAGAELLAGQAFADCPEFADWLRAQRERRQQARHMALARLAALHEAAGEWASAIEAAQQLLVLAPLSEHALRCLMRLHYLRGDRAAAIAVFEGFEQHLKDELGARPDAETVALLATVEAAPGALAIARATSSVPASLLKPPRLVGRETELAALTDAWRAGRVFLVQGEAGMGKSRLLAEWVAQHPGAVVVQARPGDAGVPFALLARLLRTLQGRVQPVLDGPVRAELARVLPELHTGPALAGEGQRLLLQVALQGWLQQAAQAGVHELVLDDLHFADPASLEMLLALLALDALDMLRWGLAQRPGEGAAAVALHHALLDSQRLQPVTLGPLGASAVQELVASLQLPEVDAAALTPALLRHTGGNPLYLLETLKDLLVAGAARQPGLPQPASVGTLIERRLRALSPAAVSLVRVAALAGVDFTVELAAQVLQTPVLMLADAWQELEAAHVLTGAGFAHDLVQEAALRLVPDEIARHVHGAIAHGLQGHGTEPARVAWHWQRAERPAAAAAAWEAAAAKALAAARPRESLGFWAQAAQAWREAGDPAAAERARVSAEPAAMASLDADALRQWGEQLLADVHDPRLRCLALVANATVASQLEEPTRAQPLAQEAAALARALGDPVLTLRSARALALALSSQGLAAQAAAALDAEMRAGLAHLPDVEQADFCADHGVLLERADRRHEALARQEQARQLAARAGAYKVFQDTLSNAAVSCAYLGRLDQAVQLMQQSVLMGRTQQLDGFQRALDEQTLAALHIEAGRFGAALDLLMPAEEALRSSGAGSWARMASDHLRLLWSLLGQRQRARQAAQVALADMGDPRSLAAAQFRLRLALESGEDPEPAAQDLRAAREGRSFISRHRLSLDILLARTLPPATAAGRLDALAQDAAGCLHLAYAQNARGHQVRALLDSGEVGASAQVAQSVLAQLPSCHPFDLYLPELWLNAHDALAAAGRREEARAVLDTAQAWIERAALELPAEFGESFRVRNPVNRRLLTLS